MPAENNLWKFSALEIILYIDAIIITALIIFKGCRSPRINLLYLQRQQVLFHGVPRKAKQWLYRGPFRFLKLVAICKPLG